MVGNEQWRMIADGQNLQLFGLRIEVTEEFCVQTSEHVTVLHERMDAIRFSLVE
jgi:hypothetical protein